MTLRKGYVRGIIVLVWLATMLWLIRFEVMPEAFSATSGGYKALFSRDVLIMDSWMQLIFKGQAIGFSHSSVSLDEKNPKGRHVVNNQVRVRMNLMGTRQQIYVNTVVKLDDVYQLQSFSFSMASTDYRLEIKGARRHGEVFGVTMTTGSSSQNMDVTIPDDVVIYSPMTEMAMKELKPGQSMQIKTLDPTTMSTASVTIKAVEKQVVEIGGAEHDAMLLSTDYRGMTIESWIDEKGQLLRQETPFGWTMQKCTMEEATRTLTAEGDVGEDMLTGMAVPCKGKISEARAASQVRLRLTGVSFDEDELSSGRQHVEQRSETEVVLTVRSAKVSDSPDVPFPNDVAVCLAPSFTIQSEHEELQSRAQEVVAGLETNRDKAMALFDWVYKHVAKEMTVSLPSALDVLRTMKGDCNEHTYLYVALCRAAGLPAKVKVGLAYHRAAFYYHAWPAVYVGGQWLEVDPTWGQKGVDATHLALAEGELADQMELVKVMGRLQIEVLGNSEDE
ncbi:MAG: transglutaminase domain-containing protein [Kiritimatiellae bacterium]|nr:transglutaminase domain-containing protein [Kiritimatiellia bacterium]